MVACRMMDESCPVPTCLHGGPISLAECRLGVEAYIETHSAIPTGAVAGALAALARQYGASGVMAVDSDLVVGKLRFWPEALRERLGELCVQQEEYIRPLIEAVTEPLPELPEPRGLRLDCVQVAADYRGQGLAGRMLDETLAWARATGWQELRATAIGHIPPLLDWSGQISKEMLARRGFQVISRQVHPALREGAVAQRTGVQGAEMQARWAAFADLSDDEAGMMYEMVLPLEATGPAEAGPSEAQRGCGS